MHSAAQYVRLETVGRRTGRPHAVIVRYVMFGGRMVVFPQAGSGQDWVANIERNHSVRVYGGGKNWEGRASLATVGGLKDPVLGAFTRKYGEAEVRKRYWGQRRYVQIELLSQREEDYSELVYSDLEAAFDGVAESYDQHIMGNPMNLWLRNRSVSLLTQLFKAGDIVLEIGCGTGTETLRLAERGIKVLAADISSKMLEVMMRKARAAGLERNVIPLHCRPHEVRQRVIENGYDVIDGGYSTYGAVNTEPKLDVMFENLHALIRDDGKLVLGVWNKYCIYEMFGYSMRMRPSMIVARLRNPVPVGKSRFCVATNAFSVGSLNETASKWFKLQRVVGVEILLPPSNLVRYLPPASLLRALTRADEALEGRFPWNRLGDHFLAVYSKAPVTS